LQVSEHVMEQLRVALPTLDFDEVVSLTRKKEKDRPRVTVLVSSQINACDYYRAFIPLKELDKREVISARMVNRFSALDGYSSDLLVCYRPKDRGILKYANAPASNGAKLLADYDDDVLSVPSANFLEPNFGEPDKEASLSIASRVTQLSTSTQRLRDLFSHVQPKCAVLPNVIDWGAHDHLLHYYPKRNNPRVRIGWAGTYTHTEDLMGVFDAPVFLSAIREIMYKYPNTELWMFGMCPEELRQEFIGRVNYKRPVHLFEYMAHLASLNLDLMCYPLKDFQFNYSKSNIRWLECSLLHVPVLATPIHSYRGIGSDLCTTVPSSAEAWFNAIEHALLNLDEYRERAVRSREHVRDHWSIQATWPSWYSTWAAAAEGRSVIQDFTPPPFRLPEPEQPKEEKIEEVAVPQEAAQN
jgi:hypothetical protein